MKTICHALFALSALLIASCSKQTSDIIEWSTNGVTGVRMPLHVTFVENVQVEESAMQDAISITPAVGFDAYLSGMRMIRIVPKSPVFIGISGGEESSATLHPLFTTLHLRQPPCLSGVG